MMMGVFIFYICFLNDVWFDCKLIVGMWLFVLGFVLLLVEIYKEFEECIGYCILECYGMIEINMMMLNLYDGDCCVGMVG